MTAAQLAYLAELAALAADYFVFSDPDAARVFGDSALRAETLSAEVQRDERRLHRNWDTCHAPSGQLVGHLFRLIRTSHEAARPTLT